MEQRNLLEQIQHCAGNGKYDELASLLAQNPEADVNGTNIVTCPLKLAIMNNNKAVVGLLLDHGADPNARDSFSITPLHLAAQNASDEIVKLLLEHGANPQLRSNKGGLPLDWARYRGIGLETYISEGDANNWKVRERIIQLLGGNKDDVSLDEEQKKSRDELKKHGLVEG